ncbi:MAG: flagellar filament capping protein FliD, partial [Acidobacteria bacterium]|nr:flagellar filament capping protein FliD [Acidobacteriota bacterium]
TVSGTDTLQDLRDRINNANTGVNGTGVTASIVQTSATGFILVLTAADTGTDMVITDSGSVLSGLGISSTNGVGGTRNGLTTSKIEVADGFDEIVFDGTQGDDPYKITYDQASTTITVTLLDGTGSNSDTYVLTQANGTAETATFTVDGVGITIEVGTGFAKDTDITVTADVYTQVGTGLIDDSTIEITGSTGDISGITSKTLTIDDASTQTAIVVSVGSFTGTFDGTGAPATDRTLTLSDGNGNSLTIQFDVTTSFDGTENTSTITLNELENVVAAAAGTNFDNELQTARSARFTADGLIDADRFESHFITSSTSTLSSLAPEATAGDFKITVGADTVTVNYLLSDTLSGLVTKINDAITAAGGGNAVFDASTAASLMTDGDGVRLVIAKTSGAAITLTDTNGLVAGLGIDNDLVIERDSNTVSDLFDGVTLTLFQAEEETKIKLDIEKDLASAKTAIEGFVNAYNTLKSFLNLQSAIDSTTGAAAEDSGILFGTSALFGVASSVSSVFSQATAGVDKAFKVLAQVGITFVDNNSVADPMLFNTLEISDTKLDEALLNNPDDVRRLFAFDFSTSDPRVSLLGFTGKTSFNTSGYKLNINFDDRFQSQTFTDGGSFTELDATTAGPAGDGVSAIAFSDSVLSGNAYRYSYDSTGGELLTLTDLTSGTSQTIDITSILDGIGDGDDLDSGETAAFNFSNLGVTLTLTGDGSPTTNFKRGTDIITSGSLTVNATNITVNGSTGVVTDNDGGVTQTGLAELKALANPSIYDQATGKLTINFDSSGAGNLVLAAAGTAGLEFSVDSGGFSSAPGTNLDDGLSHTIDIRLVRSREV